MRMGGGMGGGGWDGDGTFCHSCFLDFALQSGQRERGERRGAGEEGREGGLEWGGLGFS